MLSVEINTKYINTLSGQTVEFLYVKPANTYSNQVTLTLWGPRNEIKEKTLHFIRKTNLNTIQIIIFIAKDKKIYKLLQNFGGIILKPLGLQNVFFKSTSCDIH